MLAAAVEEREMLIRLDHPNIVRIYDIVDEGGIPYIVMAFVKGTSWKQMYDKNGGAAARNRGAAPDAGHPRRLRVPAPPHAAGRLPRLQAGQRDPGGRAERGQRARC